MNGMLSNKEKEEMSDKIKARKLRARKWYASVEKHAEALGTVDMILNS